MFALLTAPLLAQPTISSTISWSGDTGTFTAAAGDAAVVFGYNFTTGSATATLDGNPVSIALTSSTNWPTIWDSGTAISTVWVVPNLSAGSHTFVISNAGGDHFASSVGYDITGTATVNPVEYVAGSVAGSGTSCTGTATTTHTGDLLISTINAAGSPSVSLGSSTQTMTLMGSGAGTPSTMHGVTGSVGAVTAVWNLGSSASYVCDTVGLKPVPGTEPTVSSVATSPTSPSVVANAHITLTSTATYSDGGLQNVSGAASTWASSNTATANISTLGVVNPNNPGTTNITATFGGVTSPNNLVTVTAYTPAHFYIRTGGGTRYSSNMTSGQCDGQADVDYPGTGTNQHCAFNQYQYMWQDGSATDGSTFPGWGWLAQGGDIILIHGGPYRIGWLSNTSSCSAGICGGINGNAAASGMPNPPSGYSGAHTQILGEHFAACNTGNAPNLSLLTQLYGGFSVGAAFDIGSAYVDVKCIEITDHSACTKSGGALAYPKACATSPPLDDFAANGIQTSQGTSNVLFQDVYVHGVAASGMLGPIGGPITMNRMIVNFNSFAAWNMDDGHTTPDLAGSSITANYVTMVGNGCNEEYPIVDTAYPASVCYDLSSGGFGDSWSGQDTELDAFTCNHCDQHWNTKDGFIGPHTFAKNLTVTQSTSYGNMGQQWKWSSARNATHIFTNNYAGGNCYRMSQPLPGASSTYLTHIGVVSPGSTPGTGYTVGDVLNIIQSGGSGGQATVNNVVSGVPTTVGVTPAYIVTSTGIGYSPAGGLATTGGTGTGAQVNINNMTLGLFCRASGDNFNVQTDSGSTNLFAGNTIVGNANVAVDYGCNTANNCGGVPIIFRDNVFLGYFDNNYTTHVPTPFYLAADPTVAITEDHNLYFNTYGSCPPTSTTGAGDICTSSPAFVGQPTSPFSAESVMDNFNFLPSSGSPVIGAGVAVSGLTVDYNNVSRPNPPSIGALEFAAGPPTVAQPTCSPAAGTYTSTQTVTCTTTTPSAVICGTTNGSTPTSSPAGTCSNGTAGPFTIAVTSTLKAIGTLSGDTDSSVFSGLYTITPPSTPSMQIFGSVVFQGTVKLQ